MKEIFLLIDTADKKIKKSVFEILSHIRDTFGKETAVTAYSPDILDDDQIEMLKGYSVASLYIPKVPMDISQAEHHMATVAELVKDREYDSYFGTASDWNNSILSSIAFEKGCEFYENCTGISIDDEIILKKPFYGDKVIAGINAEKPFAASFRQKTFPVKPARDGVSEIQITGYELVNPSIDWIFEGLDDHDGGLPKGIDIKDADIVVSVGRGIQERENISRVRELIDLFDGRACLGASRVVVDQGWASFSNQVGQTGKIVAPTLYIALGISGAVQHQVGMNPSRYILAVNKDPEAPIFEICDYGIVDDLFEFLPVFIEELKKLRQ